MISMKTKTVLLPCFIRIAIGEPNTISGIVVVRRKLTLDSFNFEAQFLHLVQLRLEWFRIVQLTNIKNFNQLIDHLLVLWPNRFALQHITHCGKNNEK